MQRRAAAIYFALFLVIGAGAYAYTGVAQKPHVDVDQYGQTYVNGDELTVDGRTYAVSGINLTGGGGGGGHGGGGGGQMVGTLTWTDSDATFTASLENNTTASWQTVSWEGQAGVEGVTLQNGSSVQYNGSVHDVLLNESASPPTVTLRQVGSGSGNDSNVTADTYELGDMVTFHQDDRLIFGATITEVTGSTATLQWGDEFYVSIPNETDPSTVSLTQQFNVTRRLTTDPQVRNGTVTIDGEPYVVNRTTNQNTPLSEYLPEPQVTEFSEGDELTYNGNVTTIGNITREAAPLSWTGAQNKTVDLSEGASLSLNDQEYFVHFPGQHSVQLVENTTDAWNAYQSDLNTIDVYNERMAGLWGVTILSFLAAFVLLVAAYLPVKD